MVEKLAADGAVSEKKTRSLVDAIEYLEDRLNVSDATRDKIHDTLDRLNDLMDEAKVGAGDTTKQLRRQVRRHPGATIAVAAAAGLVVGLLLRRD